MQIICDVHVQRKAQLAGCIEIQGSACSAVCRAVQNKRQNPARSRRRCLPASKQSCRAAASAKDGAMWTASRVTRQSSNQKAHHLVYVHACMSSPEHGVVVYHVVCCVLVALSLVLPLFQIISHFKNFGELKFFKFDQIYITK